MSDETMPDAWVVAVEASQATMATSSMMFFLMAWASQQNVAGDVVEHPSHAVHVQRLFLQALVGSSWLGVMHPSSLGSSQGMSLSELCCYFVDMVAIFLLSSSRSLSE